MTRRCGGGARAAGLLIVLAGGVAWADGTPGAFDSTFGGDGIVVTPTSGGHLNAVAAQSDGAVVAAGYETTGVGSNTRWVVRRYLATGDLDSAFGASGTARLFGSYSVDQALDCAVDSAGRVVVVGKRGVATNSHGGYATMLAVVRLTAAGAVDSSFGSGGVVQPSATGVTSWNDDRVAIQADGRIVVGATGSSQPKKGAAVPGFVVLRYLDTGAADPSFAGSGSAFRSTTGTGTSFAYSGRPLGIQSDGGVVIGANAHDAGGHPVWTLVRFFATGAVDTAFGTVTAFTGDSLFSLRIDASDRIVAAGDRGAGPTAMDTLTRRYLAGGGLDTSFGSGGEFVSGLPGRDYAGDVAVQSDGAIVLALTLETVPGSGLYDFAPLRLSSAGAPDATYGIGGIGSMTGLATAGTWAWSVAILPNGDALLGGRHATDWVLGAYLAN